jgi:dihydrofolate synthase/folylpolyglutamate synthase
MNLNAWLELLEKRHPQAIDMGLDRCGAVYRQLGSPRPAKTVFTVAGTNGKGSTVAYIAAISAALGQKCGTFTSPHIFSFNERISIMGDMVSDECLLRAFEKVEAARGEISLTYFEFTTLAAFLVLNESDLDCAVLEVGLGGRLDAVNLIDTDCAVITPVGMDHQEFLGSDLASIATEKAGIIRARKPLICTQEEPPDVIFEMAKSLQAPVYIRGSHFHLRRHGESVGTSQLSFSIAGECVTVPQPRMGGIHQSDNLAAALAAVFVMNPACSPQSEKISTAIRECKVPGRLQKVCSDPEILLDVGHNELAAQAIAAFFNDRGKAGFNCVLAMLSDKSVEAVARAFGSLCKHWLCATSTGSRGQSGELIAGRIRDVESSARISSFESVEDAMTAAVSKSGADETILVFGSFTTVSSAARWLHNRIQQDDHDAARIT